MDKKTQILIAATELFFKSGFANVSMDMVSQVAKVSKATIYAHFKNKEQLLVNVLNYYRAQNAINFPYLPEHPAENFSDFIQDIEVYLFGCFNYFTNDKEVDAMRLLIAESAKFPELFEIYFAEQATHVTSNLALYLEKYSYEHNKILIPKCYLIACQIVDMLRGQTLWVKLLQNPKRKPFLLDRGDTISKIMESVVYIINGHSAKKLK